ncbi:MAG: GNAT family N-acetyltransferase [Desulfobacterales bacterium]|nr:GNAT family N-acetyltransferase [Desulfobacterales bacterium]
MQEVEFHEARKKMGKECETVLLTVPDWFGREKSLLEYIKNIDNLDTFTAWFKDELIGFFSVKSHNKHSVELYVLAVKSGFHGRGIGTKLYQFIEQKLKEKSVKYVQVKTLSPKAGDLNFEKIMQFYLSLGFLPLEDFPKLWSEDTPCLQMIKGI